MNLNCALGRLTFIENMVVNSMLAALVVLSFEGGSESMEFEMYLGSNFDQFIYLENDYHFCYNSGNDN